ncbi:MAG: hypothetical protein KKD44_03150 [Proteobacteria bacterium]|nr:hypothetical protein [Pseudomonadota bacterium]
MIRIHALNVGQGDCAIIEHAESRLTVVDINRSSQMDWATLMDVVKAWNPRQFNGERFLYAYGAIDYKTLLKRSGYTVRITDPIPYIKALINKNGHARHGLRFISSRPDITYFSGLWALNRDIGIASAWVPPWVNNQTPGKSEPILGKDQEFYAFLSHGTWPDISLESPSSGGRIESSDAYDIQVISPQPSAGGSSSTRDGDALPSCVLIIRYGKSKMILGNNASKEIWSRIVSDCPDDIKNTSILKASHHGQARGFHMDAVKLMKPEYTILNLGIKEISPLTTPYARICPHAVNTRHAGSMIFEMDRLGHVHLITGDKPNP